MTRKPGRPRAIIDWQQVGKLLEAGCQATGIAEIMGVEEDTLRKRCPVDNKCSFSEFSQQKKAKGDEQLRVKQYQTAMAGNVTMQIWLGKNRLGQADKSEMNINFNELSDEDLQRIVEGKSVSGT